MKRKEKLLWSLGPHRAFRSNRQFTRLKALSPIPFYLSIHLPTRSYQSIRLFDILFHAGVHVLFRRQRDEESDIAPPPRRRWSLT